MTMRIYLFPVFICLGFACFGQINQKAIVEKNSNKIIVSFVKDDRSINIADKFKLVIKNGNETFKIGIKGNQLILPHLDKDTGYTVIFMYKNVNLVFNRIFKKMLLADQDVTWRFGIDNRPFNDLLGLISNEEYEKNTSIKQIQYLQLDPMEDGDGIQFVHKIEQSSNK